MSILQINLGTHPNDSTGDDLRTAFQKVNYNDDYLNISKVENGESSGGLGAPVFLEKLNKNLVFRTIKSANSKLGVSFNTSEIILDLNNPVAVIEDPNPKLGGNLDLNSYDISGTGNIAVVGTILSTAFFGNLMGDVNGTLTGGVNGTLIGDSFGLHIGSVLGNVAGQVSDITNHSLSELSDISSQSPLVGQSLTWDGFNWIPQTIISGVSKIIPGSNISISPSSGVGEVTINSIGGGAGGGNLDFGTFSIPSGFTLDLGSFV